MGLVFSGVYRVRRGCRVVYYGDGGYYRLWVPDVGKLVFVIAQRTPTHPPPVVLRCFVWLVSVAKRRE